jgi:uncharacterized DUF497 family protein
VSELGAGREVRPFLVVAMTNCRYNKIVIIVWDEPKRQANLIKHWIDFGDIDEEFFAAAVIRKANADRWFTIGRLNGVVTVIFARLGTEGISIISARAANRKEKRMLE